MTTGRQVVQGALTFHLNRLAPGETLDPDTAATCLAALNSIADELNGTSSFLWREVSTVSTPITGTSASLGVDWAGLTYGQQILGATVQFGGLDIPMDPLTAAQYQEIAIKAISSIPGYYSHDGGSTVSIYPAATGQTITLRTNQSMSSFVDLDTDYSMPNGYLSALQAMLAEKVAPSLLGGLPPAIAIAAKGARLRLGAQACNPAIIGATAGVGPVVRIMRGY